MTENTNFPQIKTPRFSHGVLIATHRLRQFKPKRKPYRWLLQSFPVAHGNACLVLLRSSPDTVHSMQLHGTLLSTLLIRRGLP